MTATVVVSGALGNKPGQSGETWVKLSWVRGLQALGMDVRFVEELAPSVDAAAASAWFGSVADRFGLKDRATLLKDGRAIVGPAPGELKDVAPEAALVNISGHLRAPDLLGAFGRRVFVDIDPGFTQFWHAQGLEGAGLEGHDAYFTIGELIGTPGCPIPTGGIQWRPVRQPVVLDDWPAMGPGDASRFTTIASWRGPFGPVVQGERTYGLKVHEFRKFIELPRHSPHRFEIALDIDPADRRDLEGLQAHGWMVADPQQVAGDPDALRDYVQGSDAEFSAAQGMYVDTRCGWFSDRTTRYLASGRPALVQDTGFSATLPVGDGLVAFRTLEEAIAGAADIANRYAEHCDAARQIAEEHFAAERVLAQFCDQVGID
jgi:hypothetical protein